MGVLYYSVEYMGTGVQGSTVLLSRVQGYSGSTVLLSRVHGSKGVQGSTLLVSRVQEYCGTMGFIGFRRVKWYRRSTVLHWKVQGYTGEVLYYSGEYNCT